MASFDPTLPDRPRPRSAAASAPARAERHRGPGESGPGTDATALDATAPSRPAGVLGAALSEHLDALLDPAERGVQLRSILEQLPAGVIIAEAPGGRLLGYNRRAAELWGGPLPLVQSAEEYAPRYPGLHADGRRYRADEYPLARAVRQGETVVDEEIELELGSGRTRTLLVSASPIRDAAGEVRTAVATLVDVTQRRAEERSRAFAARLSELFQGCGDEDSIQQLALLEITAQLSVSGAAFLEFDAAGEAAVFRAECRSGVACAVAAPALADLGAGVAEAVRRSRLVTITDAATDARVGGPGLAAFDALSARSALGVTVRREGRPAALLLLLHAAPRDWSTAEAEVAAQLADRAWSAVEAVRADSTLQKRDAWLRLALRGASAAAWEWDLWSGRLAWTPEHRELLGAGPARPLATVEDFLAILHDEDRERTRRAIARVTRVGQGDVEFEFRIVRAAQVRWLRAQGSVLTDPTGRPARAFGVLLDVTPHKEAELEREALLARLEEANQAKSNFIGVMSHEFRTPLTSVIGYADLLATGAVGPLTEKQAQHLGRIKASAWHLTQVIDEVLTFSRMEAGREEVQQAPVDCDALAREAAAIVEPAAYARGLTLVCEAAEGVRIVSDEGKLRQVLINLLGNAVKFTDEGSVTLRVRSAADHVSFEVEDTGIGIAECDLERIFERFWQVDQGPTRTQGGTGLGLTVSRRLTELLGGRLTVASRVGHGSVFRAVLPRGR